MDAAVAGAEDAVHRGMGCPVEGAVDTASEMVDMGTLVVKVVQLVDRRYCVHVDHECWANLQKLGNLTEEGDRLGGMDDSFE
jgi:hypothetical protein